MWSFWAFTCLFLWYNVFDAAWPLHLQFVRFCLYLLTRNSIPVPARSKASVCGWSLAGILGSNPAGDLNICLLFSVVCCQAEITATGWSLVQRSPTDCGVSECDREASTMRRPWPTGGGGFYAMGGKIVVFLASKCKISKKWRRKSVVGSLWRHGLTFNQASVSNKLRLCKMRRRSFQCSQTHKCKVFFT